jgi:hypothetical protein
MNTEGRSQPHPYPLERFLAILGALACIALTVVIWRNVSAYQGMWPLPALYFLEIPALTVMSAVALVRRSTSAGILVWVAAGALGAFCLLGLFSVGLIYMPIFLVVAGAAIASELHNSGHFPMHLAIFLLSGLAQAALMLAAIRWLYPASF